MYCKKEGGLHAAITNDMQDIGKIHEVLYRLDAIVHVGSGFYGCSYKVFPLLFYYLAGRSDTLSDGLDDVYCGGAGC